MIKRIPAGSIPALQEMLDCELAAVPMSCTPVNICTCLCPKLALVQKFGDDNCAYVEVPAKTCRAEHFQLHKANAKPPS